MSKHTTRLSQLRTMAEANREKVTLHALLNYITPTEAQTLCGIRAENVSGGVQWRTQKEDPRTLVCPQCDALWWELGREQRILLDL